MIRFSHVSKRYPTGRDALRDISFEVERGEFAFVTGHSGAGKSTLLRLVAALERCSGGEIRVGGSRLDGISRRRLPFYRRNVGFVFQDHRLLADRTVFDNVALPLVIAEAPRVEVTHRVRAALDKVGLLGKELQFPVALSGGEQQRVGIARAVVNRPPILVADEPTGNLDPLLAREVMRLFVDFARVGVTVLLATHDVNLLRELPYRVLALNEGRLQEIDRSALTVHKGARDEDREGSRSTRDGHREARP